MPVALLDFFFLVMVFRQVAACLDGLCYGKKTSNSIGLRTAPGQSYFSASRAKSEVNPPPNLQIQLDSIR